VPASLPLRAHEACGCIGHPAFPAPSDQEGATIPGKPRALRAAGLLAWVEIGWGLFLRLRLMPRGKSAANRDFLTLHGVVFDILVLAMRRERMAGPQGLCPRYFV
jgi:hypothetical protein